MSARALAVLTPRRIGTWTTGLLVLTWGLYAYSMATPGYIDRAHRFKAADFIQFYVMGSLASSGQTDALYDSNAHLAEGRRRIDPELGLYAGHVNYGPQVAFAFAPLARLPYPLALALFLTGTVVLYGVSVWLLWRDAGALASHGRLVALVAAASPLLAVVLRYGQLSVLPLFVCTAALAAFRRGRPFAAGLFIGCLAFKPQLGLVLGVVLIASRNWRAVAGAAVTGAGQLTVAWLLAGTVVMRQYFAMLLKLAGDPGLVQLYPSEVHSWRGFLQLLAPASGFVPLLTASGLVAALALAVLAWQSTRQVALRFSIVVILTILGSPHLLSYDLVLLTIPLVAVADWAVSHPTDPWPRRAALLLVPLYFAPFSSNLARAVPLQLSVITMAAMTTCLFEGLRHARPLGAQFLRGPRPSTAADSATFRSPHTLNPR